MSWARTFWTQRASKGKWAGKTTRIYHEFTVDVHTSVIYSDTQVFLHRAISKLLLLLLHRFEENGNHIFSYSLSALSN